MAKRPSWSGFLKLSLVTCPVRLFSATTNAHSISFHFIHPETHNRIQMKPFDPKLGEVERKDLVRGYEIGRGRYVVVTDVDLARIRLKSTRTLEIEKFVEMAEIDPIYFDGAYYVVPDGKPAIEAYAVIREAMRKERRAALGRLAISYREHVATIEPRGDGMILHRMRDAREVEAQAPFDELKGYGLKGYKVDPKMVEIATQIIEQKKGAFEPAEFTDPYEEALIDMLKRRAKGAEPLPEDEAAEAPTGNVVRLMDALRGSLGGRRKAEGGEHRVVRFRRPARGGGRTKGKPAARQRKRAGGR